MRIITIAMLALLTTSAQANQSNLDVKANIESGCSFNVSSDRVNFNTEDYTITADTLGGKGKDLKLNVNCSNGISYSIKAKDIDNNNNTTYFNLNHNDETNTSKFNYTVTSNGNNVFSSPIRQTSAGLYKTFPLRVSIARSSYNPSAGDYTGGFELVFTY